MVDLLPMTMSAYTILSFLLYRPCSLPSEWKDLSCTSDAPVLITKFSLQSSRYKAYYERFRSIFTVDPSTSVLYIPGNHDVGCVSYQSFVFDVVDISPTGLEAPSPSRRSRVRGTRRTLARSIAMCLLRTIRSSYSTPLDWSKKIIAEQLLG